MNTPWNVKAKARLKELGRTQAWLARAVNASEPAVSLWLKGVHNPNLMKIKRIAELLELSFAELVEEDEMVAVMEVAGQQLDDRDLVVDDEHVGDPGRHGR